MQAYIDLDLIKHQINMDLDYHREDEYLLYLADVAVRAVENHIDHDITDYVFDGQLDPPLLHACLLIIGNYYQNRESVTYGAVMQVPQGYEYLLQRYVDYSSENPKDCQCNCE